MEDFPEDADDPIVIDIESEFPVILISVSGQEQEFVVREIADELEDRILDIPGVSRVVKQGFRNREKVSYRTGQASATKPKSKT